MYKQLFSRYRFLLITGIFICLLASAGLILLTQKWPHPRNSVGQQIPLATSMLYQAGGTTNVAESARPISVKLSEGQALPQAVIPLPLATGQPLTDEELQQLLSRLPTLEPATNNQSNFKLAQEPLPPPRPGETVQQPFPPTNQPTPPAVASAEPLKVLRFAPEGEIPIAPFVSITFNQPMVALATLQDLSAKDVPVQIEPALEGTWRWLGSKTLTFEYDSKLIDRLPKATLYKVTIPAGTQSVTGGVLEKSVEWSFSTPPVKIASSYPNDTPQPLDPLFFISFDQRIDRDVIIKFIQVKAGSQVVSLKLVPDSEAQADPQVNDLVKNSPEGRWLAFRVTQPLPQDTAVVVSVLPGAPSAEGSLVTQEAQSFNFHTYAALKIVEHGCNFSNNGNCQPLNPFYIRFNNPLDSTAYKEAMVTIQPQLPGATVNVVGDTIMIQGASQGQTTYTVVVSKDLKDSFGQRLGQDASLTFQVGKADSSLVGPNQSFITLDPSSSNPVFTVYTINYTKLVVRIYSVQPSDWPAFKQYLRNYQQGDAAVTPPGNKVFDKAIPVESSADKLTEVDIDLKQVMDGPSGQFIVIVDPPQGMFKPEERWRTVQTWVQVTQIGLDAFVDHSQMVVWTNALKDGAPLTGITITPGPTGSQVITGEDGLAKMNIPVGATYLVAKKGSDQAMLPSSTYFWDDGAWNVRPVSDLLLWYVFDDRQMYKPGEDIHLKGWLRRMEDSQDGDVSLVGGLITNVNYHITDPQGSDITSGTLKVNALGGFDLAFTLPQAVNLGYAKIIFEATGALDQLNNTKYYHSFQIQEFRRPEYEVAARNEIPGPYFAGGEAVVAVAANYYAGGPLPDADVTWQVTTTASSYSPPNWPDFTFGTWQPWWNTYGTIDDFKRYPPAGESKVESFTGKTDATGTHYLKLDISQSTGLTPVTITAEASVMDVNRQTWAARTSLLVHPASLYVGLRSSSYFVERGTPLKVDFIVTDIDGNPVASKPVDIEAARMEWKYKDGAWAEVAVDVQKCNLNSTSTPATCTFATPVGGSYKITAIVSDDQGRKNQSQFTRWVSGGQEPPSRKVDQETVTLIPDKESYQPGDVAKIMVQSPFSPAEGLLTVNRSGILYTQRFHIEKDGITLSIPIQESYIPNLNIEVDLTGSAPRVDDQNQAIPNAPPRPAYASSQLELKIPPLQRTLAVAVTPEQKELEPGQETTVHVVVKDANGQPVSGAELAVVVVDEAILSLTNYQLRDPLSVFYFDRSMDLVAQYSRANLVLADPLALAHAADGARAVVAQTQVVESKGLQPGLPLPAAGGAMDSLAANAAGLLQGSNPAAIRLRSDFNPLAAFSPTVQTDANGAASVAVKLPDNLTRYRVMVVAVDNGKRFGTGESSLTARLALMVRLSAPRFLNLGDQFELPVVLQNQTDEPMTVNVAIQTTNLTLTGSSGMKVTIPARDRVEVRFPASTQMAGSAHIQAGASSNNFADAASADLPVYTPATSEAFATYGVLDEGSVIQPVTSPSNVFPQYGGLEINTSSTALQTLTDAVLYLVQYPYEGSEQIASRLLAITALRDVLTAFKSEGMPSPADLETVVASDITQLQGLQNDDGGFPYWQHGQDSIPINTIHVAHALQEAKQKGYPVSEDMTARVVDYLRQIETHYPSWYNQQTRQTLSAYALYVRYLMGDNDADKARHLLDDAGLDKMDMDAVGWLWPTLLDDPNAGTELTAIRNYVNNHVVETAGAANFVTRYDDQTYLLLSSDRRTDAIMLEAMIADNPQNDLIPKVVTGLLANRTAGRWTNTQENVFVLLALDQYFNTFETQTPDFVARIWLGEGYAGSQAYQDRTTVRQETMIPMQALLDQTNKDGGTSNLLINKEGTGRLYYRLGLSYAPTDLNLPPIDMGFVVQRTYEAVDNPGDVTKDANGVWHIKAGARVRIHLTMVATDRRYHVALTDPLPAGLEIVNPDLAVSGSIPQDPNSSSYRYGWWWWGTWYEHQNLRDERAEAFTSLLWDGVYQYTYVARATTPGRFITPPAKAEEMYSPEVFGRSSSDIVIVE